MRLLVLWLLLVGVSSADPVPMRFAVNGLVGIGGCETPHDPKTGRFIRSEKVRTQFKAEHRIHLVPRGCQIDHVVSLHCGGCDVLGNLALLCAPGLAPKERAELKCDLYKPLVP